MTRFRTLALTLLCVALMGQSARAADTVVPATQAAAPAPAITLPTPPIPGAVIPQLPSPPVATPTVSIPTPAPPVKPALKIGYADLIKIGTESAPGKAAKARFDAKGDKLKNQVVAKEKQLEKQKRAIEEKLPTMTQEQRVAKAKEFEKKVEEYRKFVQKAQKEMEPLQQELSLSIYTLIENAAQEYGKSKGLIAIVPKKELLYVGSEVESVDVTEELLQLVNERDKAGKAK